MKLIFKIQVKIQLRKGQLKTQNRPLKLKQVQLLRN